MNLARYMEGHGLSDSDMGRLIGKSRVIVNRYRRGLLLPPSAVITDIETATDRNVRFYDWHPPVKARQNGKAKRK